MMSNRIFQCAKHLPKAIIVPLFLRVIVVLCAIFATKSVNEIEIFQL